MSRYKSLPDIAVPSFLHGHTVSVPLGYQLEELHGRHLNLPKALVCGVVGILELEHFLHGLLHDQLRTRVDVEFELWWSHDGVELATERYSLVDGGCALMVRRK